ncbi:MAG: DUF554 domain-containing protein [Anaerolineae bacterium]|nr:DUF554 domain-containing protein [Anaerolineae bacterium]MDW8100483.1 DUF554 domain-containing protein [Anaerolineae bacterium]
MTGTLLNIVTVVIGSLLGTILGNRLPDKMRQTVMSGLGLMTAVVGMQMALGTRNVLLVMGSVLVGGVLGEWWQIQEKLEAVGRWLEERVGGAMGAGDERSITRAFVTASLVFCIGPMTILGSIQDGLTGDYSLLAIKSMLDGFAALAFSATLGPGVILSVLTILVFQGGISLAAMSIGSALGTVTRQTPWVIEMTAAGGVLILGISLILLDLRRIRVANLLPAIVIAPLAQLLLERLGISL